MTATGRLTTLVLKTWERMAAPGLSGGRSCSLEPGTLSAPSDGGNSNLQLGDGITSPYTMKLYPSPQDDGCKKLKMMFAVTKSVKALEFWAAANLEGKKCHCNCIIRLLMSPSRT